MAEEAVAETTESTEAVAQESTEAQEPVNEEVSRFKEVLEEKFGQGDVDDDESDAEVAESDQDVEESSVPEIDEALKSQAAELGISDEELASFGDKAPEMVQKVAALVDRQIAEIGKQRLEAKDEPAKDDAGEDARRRYRTS